jgi:lipoprotein-anchoring transpeptidase ErfK/SrfK
MRSSLFLLLATVCATAGPALAQIAPDEIEEAAWDEGDLPEGQSALTARVQILLARAAISPGPVDGFSGPMSATALAAFEEREGLPVDGRMDETVWAMLSERADGALTKSYTITDDDHADLADAIPDDWEGKAAMPHLNHVRVTERLAERFGMAESFLEALNPGAAFAPGEEIVVIDRGPAPEAQVTRVEVRKNLSRLAAFDAEGRMVANYPVTIGSATTPSPSGIHSVEVVVTDPDYTYNPENFGDEGEVLILPPGPNGPVGSVWIGLSEPGYGLHGTPEPEGLFNAASSGCVRLANFDAEELAGMIEVGATVVFLEPSDILGENAPTVDDLGAPPEAEADATDESATP